MKRWQEDLDLPPTGVVERHRVVYAPGPVRVARRLVRLGAGATGDVLSYTGRTRIVTVSASQAEAAWAAVGAAGDRDAARRRAHTRSGVRRGGAGFGGRRGGG